MKDSRSSKPIVAQPRSARATEFKTSFPKGELRREIALRGLSQKDFAARAGLDSITIGKAIQGKRLMPHTFGKILIALGAIPMPEMPAGLMEQSA
jgi:predicted transcriptional regulator